jgi:hypothetical protein
VFQVIGQEISLVAAGAIRGRLEALHDGRLPTPAELLATDAETLKLRVDGKPADMTLSAPAAGVGAVHRSAEVRGHDLEAGGSQHRLQQPAEGAVLAADVLGEIGAGVARAGSSAAPSSHRWNTVSAWEGWKS